MKTSVIPNFLTGLTTLVFALYYYATLSQKCEIYASSKIITTIEFGTSCTLLNSSSILYNLHSCRDDWRLNNAAAKYGYWCVKLVPYTINEPPVTIPYFVLAILSMVYVLRLTFNFAENLPISTSVPCVCRGLCCGIMTAKCIDFILAAVVAVAILSYGGPFGGAAAVIMLLTSCVGFVRVWREIAPDPMSYTQSVV